MNVVIHKNSDDTVSVLYPNLQLLDFVTIEQIAEKDVPHGLPYWIVDSSVIPTDRTERNQWRLDGTEGAPDGYGGESNEFPPEVVIP